MTSSEPNQTVFRTLFGGPAQVEPADENGGIFAALKDGHERADHYCPGQYSNPQVSFYLLRIPWYLTCPLPLPELRGARSLDRSPASRPIA